MEGCAYSSGASPKVQLAVPKSNVKWMLVAFLGAETLEGRLAKITIRGLNCQESLFCMRVSRLHDLVCAAGEYVSECRSTSP